MNEDWAKFHDNIAIPIITFKLPESKKKLSKNNIYSLECVLCNSEAAKFINNPREKIIGEPLSNIMPRIRDDVKLRIAIRKVVKKSFEGHVSKQHLYFHENEQIQFDVVYTCGENMLAFTYGDITKILQSYGKLLTKIKKAEQLSEAQNGFMANMSHEIRTPLNGIIGMAAILRDTNMNREQQEAVDVLLHSSYNLMAIVNDILDISKLDASAIKLRKKHMSVLECVESSYEVVRPQSVDKDLDFTFYIDDDVPEFIIQDFQRLRQVLVNLLTNAVKFTERGRVCTSVSISKKTKKHYYISFCVEDNGIGISAEDQQKLFRNFGKIHHKSKMYPGTGLGLAISQKFIELMDGNIQIESEMGVGSKFYFIIPVEKSNKCTKRLVLDEIRGKQALVVDDNPVNLRRICDLLDKWGVEHRESSSGKHAMISYVNNNRYCFDIGLIDICMPDMDGNRLSEKIRLSRRGTFPLIALSSRDEKVFEISPAFDYHLVKPYNEKDLLESMLVVLSLDIKIGVDTNIRKTSTIRGSPIFHKKSEKIAVAEDNDFNQRVIVTMLKKLGYQNVDVYQHGEALLNGMKLKAKSGIYYDVVLMDIKMPIMDGIVASNKIQTAIPHDKLPKIIAVTAAAMPGQKKTFMANGKFDGYLTKPIESVEILNKTLSAVLTHQ